MIVVTDRDVRRRLRELYEQPWNEYMIKTGGRAALDAGESSGLPAGRLRMLRGADEFAHNFDEVPVHLVVGVRLGDVLATDESLPRQSIVGGASIYPFVQNLLLALRAEGLGAALTTLLIPAEEDVKRLLEIPEDVALAAHVGVGHRADPWPAPGLRSARPCRWC